MANRKKNLFKKTIIQKYYMSMSVDHLRFLSADFLGA